MITRHKNKYENLNTIGWIIINDDIYEEMYYNIDIQFLSKSLLDYLIKENEIGK